MITDIIDLLDISIAQADQTLSSIIKPKPPISYINIEYNTLFMDNSPNLLILKHTLTKRIFNIKPTRLANKASQQGLDGTDINTHPDTVSHPWSTLKPPNPGALSRHTTLSGAGNTQIHQEEDISYVYNISAQGRNGNSNSHRTLIV